MSSDNVGSMPCRWLTHLSPAGLAVAAVAFLAADIADQIVGGSMLLGGTLDEIAHLLSTLIVLWAVGGRLFDRMLYPALIASVAIDLDHIPQELGYPFLTEGTPRPYTHSLLTIAVGLAVALLWRRRRRRDVWVGVTVGLAIHFWRDMAEPSSGVALLWPLSNRSFSIPQSVYLASIALAVACGLWRSQRRRARTRLQAAPRDP